ncbi:MAG: hypothetical protein WA851_01105 [Xanthobacteraceae bacterium]
MIEKAYLAAKAAGIVALVAANIYGPAAIADEAAGAQRVAWIAPSREPATARKNVIFVSTREKSACIDKCNGDDNDYSRCYTKAKTPAEKYACNPLYDACRRACDKFVCDPADRDAKVVESCASFDAIQKDLAERAKASLKERLERERAEKEKTEKTAAKREIFNGCTADQVSSMKSSTCISKADDDLINKRPLVHIVVCKGTEIVCCLQDDHERYSQCEAMGGMAPPKPDVVCSTLSSAKGVWQADPRSIKAGSDKHNCTQVYTCTPPLPRELSASQNKCNAVVSVSNKQVTQNGTCEPGNGSCTTCRTNPPNDPCVVTFRK